MIFYFQKEMFFIYNNNVYFTPKKLLFLPILRPPTSSKLKIQPLPCHNVFVIA